VKENNSFVQDNEPFVKDNDLSVQDNEPFVKDNNLSVQDNEPFVQDNEPFVKDNDLSVQDNELFLRDSVSVRGERTSPDFLVKPEAEKRKKVKITKNMTAAAAGRMMLPQKSLPGRIRTGVRRPAGQFTSGKDSGKE
jgi:hypothetical protein